MPTNKQIKAAGGNDVGEWGEKDISGAYDGPFMVGGEAVDTRSLPAFGDDTPSSMGGLESTGDIGDYGDIYEGERISPRVPLRR